MQGEGELKRSCPGCEKLMLAVPLELGETILPLDVCKSCQLVWSGPKEYAHLTSTPPPSVERRSLPEARRTSKGLTSINIEEKGRREPDWEKESVPDFKLYSSRQVGFAAFLGAPLGGAWLLALNFRRLGHRGAARISLLIGVLATAGVFALAFVLPESFPDTVLPVLVAVASSAIAKSLQGEAYEAHVQSAGARSSTWKAAGVGLTAAVCSTVLLIAVTANREMRGLFHSFRGNVHFTAGRLDESIAAYRKAIEFDANYAVFHYELGLALVGKGELDEAIASYRKAIEFDPNFSEAHNNLGTVLQSKGQIDDAITDYRVAIELEPDNARAHNNLGTVLQSKGQLDDAITEYRKAIELEPDNARTHNNLGSVLQGKGQLDDAITEYRKAIELEPDNARAHNLLGNALGDKGHLDEAIASKRKAIEVDPNYAAAHNSLAWTLATGRDIPSQAELDEAVQVASRALDITPDVASFHDTLATAFEKMGRLEEAAEAFRKAVELDPDNPIYKEGLQRVVGKLTSVKD